MRAYHSLLTDGTETPDEELTNDSSRLTDLICWGGSTVIHLQHLVNDLQIRQLVFLQSAMKVALITSNA
jgi:hypothetical protein